jgi:hypothetical protein
VILDFIYNKLYDAISKNEHLPWDEVHITGGRQSGKSYFGFNTVRRLYESDFNVKSVLCRMYIQDKFHVARDFAYKMTNEGFTYAQFTDDKGKDKYIGVANRTDAKVYWNVNERRYEIETVGCCSKNKTHVFDVQLGLKAGFHEIPCTYFLPIFEEVYEFRFPEYVDICNAFRGYKHVCKLHFSNNWEETNPWVIKYNIWCREDETELRNKGYQARIIRDDGKRILFIRCN